MSQAAVVKTVDTKNTEFSILKSDGLYIGGYASIEIVDKQNDLITLDALGEAVKKFMSEPRYRNVMTNHSNVQVGEVVKEHRDQSGRLWKTDVDDVGFFVVIKLRNDIEKAKEVRREIRKGSLRSFSIGGQALEKKKRNNEELGDYNEIGKLELHEITICEKGINPEAKFDILKQDVEKMSELQKAIGELNGLLEKISYSDEPEERAEKIEEFDDSQMNLRREITDVGDVSPDELDELVDSEDLGSTEEEKMSDEYLDTEEEESDLELTDSDEEEELKSKPDLPTGQVEAGEAGEEVVIGGKPSNKHAQITVAKSPWGGDTPSLDLSQENLEKAYAEFKAEQMEKLAYEDIKHSFQSRLDTELSVKKEEIAKSAYDPRTEVNQLKKQFSELLDTLKGDAEMTIQKRDNAVAALNIPSYDDISKMDWNEIHLTMQRLEENL